MDRTSVITEARSWVGTPYHHAANVKGHGVDCGMLLLEVYSKAGCFPWFDPRPYSNTFFLHGDEEIYLKQCQRFGKEVADPEPGDAALWRIGRLFAHGAVVVKWPIVIHAVAAEQICLEDDISRTQWAHRPVRFFSPWRHE